MYACVFELFMLATYTLEFLRWIGLYGHNQPTTEPVRAANGATVQDGKSFVPEVLYQGNYYPICGHYFWDNNNGATIVCKMLGFDSGKHKKVGDAFNVDAMPVGNCKPGEELTKCTAGGNAWGNFDYKNGYCKKGSSVSVEVICSRRSGGSGAGGSGSGGDQACMVLWS